jgi:hypothetical protein
MAYVSAKNGNQDLSILLRSGVHGSAGEYFALKADSFAVSYSKTPIQVPIPESSPELIDLGIFRPSITINGIVDTTQPSPVSITVGGQTYVIPFKNQLENAVYNWIASDTATGQIEIEVGDTTFPTDAASNAYNSDGDLLLPASWTGGAVYRVALQTARFSVSPAKEDRYDFQMSFVTEARQDWVDQADLI